VATTAALWIFLGSATGLIVLGATLRVAARRRDSGLARTLEPMAWLALLAGFGAVAALALAHLAGRFGPGQLWFRAPTFYVGALILAAGLAWWFSRPTRALLRFGLPAAAATVLAGGILLLRVQGASAPLAMLMPTLARPAPDFTWVDAGGKPRRLSDLRGKVVLLNFWATWCAPCRHEMPLLSKMQRDYAADGLVVLYVSLEDADVIDRFLRTQKLDGLQGRLDTAPPFYDAGRFYPLSYLIDRDGRVEKRWSGRPAESWLAQAIRAEL
jgi:cytochrome c biogenesis protein CcmG/thiol:disulfide interchange protein DsbE